MKPISTTEMPPLNFNVKEGVTSQKFNLSSNRIGWLHSLADNPGARFDIVIKDSLGRIIAEKRNFGNETDKHGELVNIERMLGEELNFSIENVEGANEIRLFVN